MIDIDETDSALAEAALRYRRERFAFDVRQRLDPATRRFDARTWDELAGMGWLAVATTEEDGGLGRRVGSMALLARAAGAAGINEPLLSTGFVAAEVLRLHASAAQRARWLPLLVAGTLRVACAFAADGPAPRAEGGVLDGRCEVVPDADIADLLLVQAGAGTGLRWYAVDIGAAGLVRESYPLLDGRGAATLDFVRCEAEPLQAGDDAAPALLAGFAAAADALGAMETAFELTLEYVKTRRQFGAAIGSNQVVVHRTVDMHIRLQEARAVLAQAADALGDGSPERQADVHAAKAFIPPQARLLAQKAVQLHGGIGITEEYAVSHCLRRILVDEQLFGSTRVHLQRFARQPLLR